MWAFGPIFDDGDDAEDFLRWLETHPQKRSDHATALGLRATDPRSFEDSVLTAARLDWISKRDAWRRGRDDEHETSCFRCCKGVPWGDAHAVAAILDDDGDVGRYEVTCSVECGQLGGDRIWETP
jgi:hypothetical protein